MAKGPFMSARVAIPQAEIADFCRRNRICRLALFGSVLRDDFRPDSDIDVLVEFEPGVRVGLAFFRLQSELSSLLGRTVDLNTSGFLAREIRESVLHDAEVIYDAA